MITEPLLPLFSPEQVRLLELAVHRTRELTDEERGRLRELGCGSRNPHFKNVQELLIVEDARFFLSMNDAIPDGVNDEV